MSKNQIKFQQGKKKAYRAIMLSCQDKIEECERIIKELKTPTNPNNLTKGD